MYLNLTRKQSNIFVAMIVGLLVAFITLTGGGMSPAAHAANIPAEQCNGVYNTAGLNLECDVTVVNNLNVATGETSSTVTLVACNGAAGAAPLCTTTVTPSSDLITSVNQCNDALNGGGGTLTCNVRVVNNIIGEGETSPATVDQCNGSGAEGTEPTTLCGPGDSGPGSTVVQCNGSVNGGGASLRVNCEVLPSTTTSLLPVTINQCNGSVNGGGSTADCSAQITNVITPPTVVVPPVDEETPPVVVPPGDGETPPVVTPPTDVTPPADVTPPTDVTPPADVTPPTDVTPPAEVTPPGDNMPPTAYNPPNGSLPPTGAEVSPAMLISGAALLAGMLLMMVAAKRKNKVEAEVIKK